MPRRISVANLTAAVVWLSVISVAVGLFFLLDDTPRPRQFAIPFMFWTFYGVLLVVITALAIALPTRKAVFYRALVLSQLALRIHTNHHEGILFERLVRWLPVGTRKLIDQSWSGEWFRLAVAGLTYLAIGLLCASIAWAIVWRWPDGARERFQFRLSHLFVLSAFVAATLAGIRADNRFAADLTIYAGAAMRLVAVVLAVTYRSPAIFCWGYLAGDFGWCLLIDVLGLEVEWDGFMQEAFDPFRRVHLLMRLLMPMYAGLAVGILSTMLYQGSPVQIEKPRG